MILFISAWSYVIVVLTTWLGKKKAPAQAFEFARPLHPVTSVSIWDRLGLWMVVAIVLVGIAYGYPILHLLAHQRYGSPPFQAF